jgi:molecular chaperone DnaJ
MAASSRVEAYAVLSDPKKRAEYDRAGFAGVAGYSPEDLFGGIDLDEIFRGRGFGADFGLGGGGGLFERFFGRRAPARGEDIEVTLTIPLEKVAMGGEAVVRVPRSEKCPDCQGTGCKAGTAPRLCETCKGTGRQTRSSRHGGVLFEQVAPCPVCAGKGRFIDNPCPTCRGKGEVERDETITVKVPPGVEENMALRVPGRGYPSATEGAAPGDLLVVIRSALDPRFERDGADLWRTETIDVSEAALGTSLKVPTLDGEAKVKVPAGSQPECVLRLAGKGLPVLNARGRGSLLLRISVHVPEKLSAEERTLFERLRELRAETNEPRPSKARANEGRS